MTTIGRAGVADQASTSGVTPGRGGPVLDARPWRRMVVLAHVLSSVAWMAAALALLALLALGASASDPAETAAAARMAHHLDVVLLAPAANAALFTGLVLALATPWGLVAHRWVLAKLALTVAQVVVGIAVLSDWLTATAEAGSRATGLQLGAPVVMAAVIAFQAWLSLAKPGGRTRWGRTAAGAPLKLPTASGWVFVLAVVAVLADGVIAVVAGGPRPVAQLAVLVVVAVARARRTPDRARPVRRGPEHPSPGGRDHASTVSR